MKYLDGRVYIGLKTGTLLIYSRDKGLSINQSEFLLALFSIPCNHDTRSRNRCHKFLVTKINVAQSIIDNEFAMMAAIIIVCVGKNGVNLWRCFGACFVGISNFCITFSVLSLYMPLLAAPKILQAPKVIAFQQSNVLIVVNAPYALHLSGNGKTHSQFPTLITAFHFQCL